MEWVCRIDGVIFRDHQWKAGDILTTNEQPGQKWDYSGGFWHLEGMTTYNPSDNNVIPRHFDPLTFEGLVDVQCVVDAREGNKVPAKFEYPKKPRPIPLTSETVAPIDPKTLKKPKARPVAMTNEEARGRVKGAK